MTNEQDNDFFENCVEEDFYEVLPMTGEWNSEFPKATFSAMPDELLDAWEHEIEDLYDGVYKESTPKHLYLTAVSAIRHTTKELYNEEIDEELYVDLADRLILAIDWYAALTRTSEKTKLDDVVVFDYKFLQNMDKDAVLAEIEAIHEELGDD